MNSDFFMMSVLDVDGLEMWGLKTQRAAKADATCCKGRRNVLQKATQHAVFFDATCCVFWCLFFYLQKLNGEDEAGEWRNL